jgi:hypothetical protein
LRYDYDVIEQYVRIGIFWREDIGRDRVAGMEFAQDIRVLHLVRHGHGFHESWNGLMVDGDLACGGVCGDHLPAHLESLIGGIGCVLLIGSRAGAASREQGCGHDGATEKSTNHPLVYNRENAPRAAWRYPPKGGITLEWEQIRRSKSTHGCAMAEPW